MARYIRYKRLKQQINFLNCNNLDRWEDTCNYRLTNFFDVCDSICNCGEYGEKEPILQYRWNNINPNYGYYCEDNDRYYKQRKEVSYDDGKTWYYTIPEEYQKGELYEANSRFCTSDNIMFEYRPDIESTPFCERYNKMQKYVKYVSFDGGTNWEVLVWNKPDGTIFKEYKTMLIEENSCDCGYKDYRFLFNDEYICGSELGEEYEQKYSYEVWREYEICSNTPTGRIEYRNPQPSCDCGFTGIAFVFSGTYACGSDIEISGITITEVYNGNIMNDNNIQTSGITFGENLDVRIKFTLEEKSNVKFNFQFSEGSNVFMMESIDTYDDFVNPLVNMNTGSYNCEFLNLSVGEHYLWLRLNNQSNRENTITLSADVKAYSTEYDRKKKYEYWYEKDVCTGVATGRFEYRNGKYDCDCGYKGNDYVFEGGYICGYRLGSSYNQTSKYEIWVEKDVCTSVATGNVSYRNPKQDCDCGYKGVEYVFEGDYICGSELGETYNQTSKYEIWVEKDVCSGIATGDVSYRNPKPSIDCGDSGKRFIRATYGEFPYGMGMIFTICENKESVEKICDSGTDIEVSIGESDGSQYVSYDIYIKEGATSLNSLFKGTDLSRLKSNIDTSKITDFGSMFNHCYSLENLDLRSFNTSNAKSMSSMFEECESLASLDLSIFDTSNVTDMNHMFYKCDKLTTLDLSNFDTRNVTDMSYMFGFCQTLMNLNISNFDTSNVKDMSYMFEYCEDLINFDLSNWNTSNVTNMNNMFEDCYTLKTLNLSNWNTSNVTNMNNMFSGCLKLTSLDLSSFDTSNVTDMGYMFYNCVLLNHIKCTQEFKDWCITNQDIIKLPKRMQEGGDGIWEIV